MRDLSELIDKWQNSALELREAESLINLLIVDNNRLSKRIAELEKELFNAYYNEACDKCAEHEKASQYATDRLKGRW